MKRLSLFAYIITLFVLSAFPMMTQAGDIEDGERVLTFEELGYRFDRKASGIVSELKYDFAIPRTWEPAKPTLHLHFSHSSLLLSELSGMTVYYNDVPLVDVQLVTENERDSWLQIPVPATALKSGRHSLKIAFSQRISKDRCVDNGASPGLWSIIHKDSTITFETSQSGSLDLAWFPEPFSIYGRKAVQPVDLVVSLPSEPTDSELQAAGLVMAKLGQMAGVRELNLSVQMGRLPDEGQVFVIAQTNQALDLLEDEPELPLRLIKEGFLTPDSVIVAEDEGVIQLSKRADGSGLLLLSGENETALHRAALAIADNNSLNLMSGQFTIVKDTPQQVYAPETLTDMMTLQELTGVDSQRMEGPTSEPLRYCFQLPHNWQVGADASLKLNYAYAPTLSPDRSSLLVRLNTKTLSTVKLDAPQGGLQQLDIPLDSDALIDGMNCFNFVFTLRTSHNECSIQFGGESWGEIEATSEVYLPHTTTKNDWQPNMAQYPYPFSMDKDLASTTILLPDVPTRSEIEGALELAARFGHESRHKTLQLEIKTADQWDNQADSENHLILIGDSERNSVSDALRQDLLGMSDSNETTMNVRQELILHQQAGAGMASAELLESPWASNRGVLQVLGDDEHALAGLFNLLSSNPAEERIKGNIVTVSESGTVRTVDTFNRNKQSVEISVNSQGVMVQDKENAATIRWFLIGAVVLLSQILLTAIGLTLRDRRKQLALGVAASTPAIADDTDTESHD